MWVKLHTARRKSLNATESLPGSEAGIQAPVERQEKQTSVVFLCTAQLQAALIDASSSQKEGNRSSGLVHDPLGVLDHDPWLLSTHKQHCLSYHEQPASLVYASNTQGANNAS